MEEPQVKLAVLDQKLEDLKPVVLRIDAAIEKLSEVNTTVSRMLAVHEPLTFATHYYLPLQFFQLQSPTLRPKSQSFPILFLKQQP